ncbi:MAG: 3-oxoacyl-[acyl-carrier-protein] reductase [Bacteroidales bacterium]|nr:3-oxoacyl-[acyl-carrier-protein] reductase [Lentimicrobiaceae bacterium]MDD5694251.1 3-oxoacyl-[acyl-carrier-protein] reductase [Bacteroidales bacterium]
MNILNGKIALITGASRGIGRAIALAFAAEGASIAFTDLHRDETMQDLENELRQMGVNARGYASDASSFTDCDHLVNDVLQDFGKVDILVNNAGIARDNLLMRMQENDWDMVLAVNLKSVFNMTKAIQRPMLKQRFGSIINMSSIVGIRGNGGQSNYSASKAGMIGFTKSIALELGSRNIRCNAIAPGYIESEMTGQLPAEVQENWLKSIPLRRSGKPEDVANVALFLASDLSDYVTGQVIQVCGGLYT